MQNSKSKHRKAQRRFIISTPTHGGAWFPEKHSTLSLINSHVAKVRHHATARRATSGASALTASTSNHIQRPDLSLAELEDIFADENTRTSQYPGLDQSWGSDFAAGLSPSVVISYGCNNTAEREYEPRRHIKARKSETASHTVCISWINASCRLGIKAYPSQAARGVPAVSREALRSTARMGVPKLPAPLGSSLFPFVSFPTKVSLGEQRLLCYCNIDTFDNSRSY